MLLLGRSGLKYFIALVVQEACLLLWCITLTWICNMFYANTTYYSAHPSNVDSFKKRILGIVKHDKCF